MTTVTLENIHEDLQSLKSQIAHLTQMVEEDFEISDEVREEIRASRSRSASQFVSQDEMRKEFG